MKQITGEITVITGDVMSGKTWLAKAMLKAYNNCAIVEDEPEMDRKTLKRIKLALAYHANIIITVCNIDRILPHITPNRIINVLSK